MASLHIHNLDENSTNTIHVNLISMCVGCHERYKHGAISRDDAYRVKYLLAAGRPPFPMLAIETSAIQWVKKPKIDEGRAQPLRPPQ